MQHMASLFIFILQCNFNEIDELVDFFNIADWLCVAWSPDGKYIAAGNTNNYSLTNGWVQMWEAASGIPVYTYTNYGDAQAVAWSPNSKLIASGSGNNEPGVNNTVRVW